MGKGGAACKRLFRPLPTPGITGRCRAGGCSAFNSAGQFTRQSCLLRRTASGQPTPRTWSAVSKRNMSASGPVSIRAPSRWRSAASAASSPARAAAVARRSSVRRCGIVQLAVRRHGLGQRSRPAPVAAAGQSFARSRIVARASSAAGAVQRRRVPRAPGRCRRAGVGGGDQQGAAFDQIAPADPSAAEASSAASAPAASPSRSRSAASRAPKPARTTPVGAACISFSSTGPARFGRSSASSRSASLRLHRFAVRRRPAADPRSRPRAPPAPAAAARSAASPRSNAANMSRQFAVDRGFVVREQRFAFAQQSQAPRASARCVLAVPPDVRATQARAYRRARHTAGFPVGRLPAWHRSRPMARRNSTALHRSARVHRLVASTAPACRSWPTHLRCRPVASCNMAARQIEAASSLRAWSKASAAAISPPATRVSAASGSMRSRISGG